MQNDDEPTSLVRSGHFEQLDVLDPENVHEEEGNGVVVSFPIN